MGCKVLETGYGFVATSPGQQQVFPLWNYHRMLEEKNNNVSFFNRVMKRSRQPRWSNKTHTMTITRNRFTVIIAKHFSSSICQLEEEKNQQSHCQLVEKQTMVMLKEMNHAMNGHKARHQRENINFTEEKRRKS